MIILPLALLLKKFHILQEFALSVVEQTVPQFHPVFIWENSNSDHEVQAAVLENNLDNLL